MSLDFASHRETLERRGRERLARKTQGLPLVRRFDLAFLVLFGVSGLLLLTFWSVSVATGWRLGLFDPPLVRPLPDERLLTNLRDDLDQRPLLAATLHQDHLYISQQGGDLHRYSPETELWTRQPAGELLGFEDLVDLRSDGRGLWARGAHGALARLQDGEWTSIFGESAFEDLAGASPSTEDLTSAALSGDGRWLLLGAREHGVGLFDRQRRAWVKLLPEDLATLPSPSVSHVRWWRDRFWIGGAQGLSYLIPPGTLNTPGDLDGVIIDLDAGDALWVLETRPCTNNSPRNPAKDCRRLSRFTDPVKPPEELIDERHRYPELDLAGLTVAQQQGDVLVVAGKTGLFSYDLRRHTWTRHLDHPILAHWRDPQRGLYVGSRTEAAHFEGGQLRQQWPFEQPASSQERLLRIVPGSGDEILTFTNQGHIRALQADRQIQTVLSASRTKFDPRSYSQALVLEDGQVLFRSPAGIMVHDVLRRTYRDHRRKQLPDWLFDSETRLEVAGQRIYGFQPSFRGLQSVLVTDTSRMAIGEFNEPGRVPGPIKTTTSWGDHGLAMVAGDGSAYIAAQQTLRRWTGAAVHDLDGEVWNDIALDNEKLAVATDRGLRLYWQDRRSWQDWILPGTPLRELAVAGDELRMLTTDGRLARPNAEDPFLIGGEHQDWRIAPDDLTDAHLADGQIYLAGNGKIHRYDPQRRRLNNLWLVGESLGARDGAVAGPRLIDVVGSGALAQPLSWVGQRAFVGSEELDPGAGKVVSLSAGKRSIWTLRQQGARRPRYLKGYSRDQPFEPSAQRCLFRHPSATLGRPVDTRRIRPNLLAVATTGGLELYSRANRSWYKVHWRGSPLLGELHRLGDDLALWTEGTLRLIDLSHLELPASCSRSNTVDVEVLFSVRATAVVFDENLAFDEQPVSDERQASVVWIDDTGAVRKWANGETSTLLSAPTGVPATSDLRRAFRFGQRLVFTGETAFLVYDLRDHTWRTYPVTLPKRQAGAVTALNIEGSAAPWTISAATDQGAFYTGSFDPDDARDHPIQLHEALAARRQRSGSLGGDPKALLDVQWRLGHWAFVLPNHLAVFDPLGQRWLKPIPFPGKPDPSLSLHQAVGLDVLVKDRGREWWIEQDRLSNPKSPRFARFEPGDDQMTAIDQSARVWRLRPDGAVERCAASPGASPGTSPGVYTCKIVITADRDDPVAVLEEGPAGAGLLARRRSGLGKSSQSIAAEALVALTENRAELELPLPPPLDAGWLAWIRESASGGTTGSFRINTASGPRILSSQQFFRDGRLLFEDVRAILAENSTLFHTATPDGIWTYQSKNSVVFTPVQWDGEIRAAHGRFLTATTSYHLVGDGLESPRLEPGGYPEHRIQLGSRVTLIERTHQRRLSATIEARGGTVSAFAEAGFAWDQRRGLARHPAHGPVLLTRAGLHPLDVASPETTFNLGPTGQAHQTGKLLSGPGGKPLFDTGNGSYLLEHSQTLNAGWRPVAAEGPRQTIAENDYGQLRSDQDGWHLASDRPRAATFHDGRLHLLTDAVLENLDEGLQPNAERHPAPRADLLISLAMAPGQTASLYARERTSEKTIWSRWDPKSMTLKPLTAGQDPRRDRDLVLHGRLLLKLRAGRVQSDLRVDDPSTKTSLWKPVQLTSRGFPFDRLTAIGGVDDRMLLASPAGLQVYRTGQGMDLDDPEAIYALPDRITRLGRPLSDPSRFLVITEKDCFEWKDDSLEKCEKHQSLDERWRGENDLWRFTSRRTPRGRELRGVYKDARGKLTTTEVSLRNGRLPHDQLLDLSACGNITASLWANGWFSLHADGLAADRALSLSGSQNMNNLAGQRPRRLVCVRQDREIESGLLLTRGLYALGQDRDWQWIGKRGIGKPGVSKPGAGKSWLPLKEARARDALRRPPLQEIGRLRLTRRSGSGFVYQLRDQDWKWTDLPWDHTRGQVSIDVIQDLQSDGDTLWASTSAGLVPFTRQDRAQQDRTLSLDPESLVVIPKPRIGGRPCSISDFEVKDGTAFVRCDSDSKKVFERPLRGAAENDGFRRHRGDDPFAETHFVTEESSGFWSWRLVDRRDRRPGTLEARLHGEPLGLNFGRFDFDHLRSITLSSPERIELVSDFGGWYQHPVSSLHVRDGARPKIVGSIQPQNVVRATLSRAAPDQADSATPSGPAAKLCVTTQDDNTVLLAEGVVVGRSRECAEDQGQGGLWSYDRLGVNLRMRSPGIAGGWALRTLSQGRFSDQIAVGPTVSGEDAKGSKGSKDTYHLVPTTAGVLRLDADGLARAIHAPEHQDLATGEVPAVLYLEPDGRTIYVTPTSIRGLESGALISDPSFFVPEGTRLTSLSAWTGGPGNLLRLGWTRKEEAGWTLLRATDYSVVDENMLPLDASEWGRFQRGRISWDDPSAVFGLRLKSLDSGFRTLELFSQHDSRIFQVPWREPLLPLELLPRGSSLFVVQRGEVSELRLDVGVEELFHEQ